MLDKILREGYNYRALPGTVARHSESTSDKYCKKLKYVSYLNIKSRSIGHPWETGLAIHILISGGKKFPVLSV